jgi:probable F420-dependent oxidoreductase
VLLGHLAAVTQRIELATGVLVLPQRQTALVAKQAAGVDVLSGGRLRLGVGIGWNAIEYEALDQSFRNRGVRLEEQIEVMRLLWTREIVDYAGRWHQIDRAGLNPMPVQRPIPVWLGGSAEPALRRAARLADGWMRGSAPTVWKTQVDVAQVRKEIERFRTYVQEADRDPARIGIQVRMNAAGGGPVDWAQTASVLAGLGVTHLEFNTMGAGFARVADHLAAIDRFREALAAAGVF